LPLHNVGVGNAGRFDGNQHIVGARLRRRHLRNL
jgi:hypothetical protein